MSDDAWRMFLSLIERASPDWHLKAAWHDVKDTAGNLKWDWPSYPTVYRRWSSLTVSNRQQIRHGKGQTIKNLTQPILRDKTTLGALEQVSLDGRMQDYWVDFGDGRAVRPMMLALVDVMSNVIVGYSLGRSENAADTVALIKQTCKNHGIFDRLYTDNGSAFAGHLVAGGGDRHRFRTNGRDTDASTPPGICEHLGIATTFAMPGNAKAKIAERVFATLSRDIDDRPEFKDAHAGHNPGAAPSANVIPLPIAEARIIVERQIRRYHERTGRRAQGASGRSYQAMFETGMAERIKRFPTARQLYLSGLTYKFVAVDRFGRFKVNGWTYGGTRTQDELLRYHGSGQRILVGRDPADFSEPAIAYTIGAQLICEGMVGAPPFTRADVAIESDTEAAICSQLGLPAGTLNS